MRAFARILGVTFAFMVSAFVDASAIYDYSYTFGDGHAVTGSFSGDANGNLISNLADFTAFLDGQAFNGNGLLNVGHHDGQNYLAGSGLASFDGTQNNFIVMDVPVQVFAGFTNFLVMIPDWHSGAIAPGDLTYYAAAAMLRDGVVVESHCDISSGCDTPYSPARWALVARETTPVPEPGSLLLLGFGLAGLGFVRQKSV